MKQDERLLLYQINVEDTRTLKARQWHYSHYGLLIQAALVGAGNYVIKDADGLLIGFSCLAAVYALWLVAFEAQGRIVELRWEVEKTLSAKRAADEEIRDWRAMCEAHHENDQGSFSEYWRRDLHLLIFFALVQIAGAGLAIGVIWQD